MRWPSSRDYNEAVQDPAFSFKDAELRVAETTTNIHGLPVARSGGFADVYQLRSPEGKAWAVKCFTKEVSHLHRRYQAISEHLTAARGTSRLPFMVDFQYLDADLRIGSERYPVLKMTWVEGKLLHDFVREHLDDPALLEKLSIIWHKLGQNLREAKMAHGDLQHGNVMLVPTAKGVIPRLIDYDGMYVPALADTPASEIGHANYQHPGRDADRFHFEMDRFPLLLIYTAIRCLAVGGRKLWEKFDSGDNLLFKEADIKNPGGSALCRELWAMTDPAARALVGWVVLATRMPLREVPLLDDIIGVDGKRTPALTAKQEAEVWEILFPAPTLAIPATQPPPLPQPIPTPTVSPQPQASTSRKVPVVDAAAAPLSLDEGPGSTGWRDRLKLTNQQLVNLLAVGSVCLALFVMVGVIVFARSKPGKPTRDEIAQTPPPEVQPGAAAPLPAKKPAEPKPEAKPKQPEPKQPEPKQPEPKAPVSWRAGPILEGHTTAVYGVAISADGKRAISGSGDKTLRVWDLETGKQLFSFDGHASVVLCVGMSVDGKRAMSGGSDKTLRAWDLEMGKEIHRFDAHTERGVFRLGCSADAKRVVSAIALDKTVRVWDVATSKELFQLEGHTGMVNGVGISADGKRAISSGGSDKTVRVWSLETGKELQRLDGHTDSVLSVAISSDGKRAVSGSRDKTVRVWDLETGNEIHRLDGHEGVVNGVGISADGKRAVSSGGIDKTVRVWDLDTGKQLSQFDGHTSMVMGVAISADGKRAISCGNDKTVRVWLSPDAPDLPKVTPPVSPLVQLTANDVTLKPGETAAVDIRINRNGFAGSLTLELVGLPQKVVADRITIPGGRDTAKIEITAAADATPGKATVRLQTSAEGTALKEPLDIAVTVVQSAPILIKPIILEGHAGTVMDVAISGDGMRAVSGGGDDSVRVWNLETGKELHRFNGHTDSVLGVAISTDGKRAISGGIDKTVRVWNLETGKELHRFRDLTESVLSVGISADGKWAVSGSIDEMVRVWDLELGKQLHRLDGQSIAVYGVTISADGKRALSGGLNKNMRVWNLETGKEIHRLDGHTDRVTGVGISADGRRAVSSSDDKSVRVWNLETGKELHRLDGHTEPVKGVAISADGKRAVSGGWDKTVRVWNLETGKQLHRLDGHTEQVNSVAISADGKRAVSGSHDGSVRVWNLP